MRDLEVLQYYFVSMEDACNQLQAAIGANNTEDANKLKSVIINISDKIDEELG